MSEVFHIDLRAPGAMDVSEFRSWFEIDWVAVDLGFDDGRLVTVTLKWAGIGAPVAPSRIGVGPRAASLCSNPRHHERCCL